MIRRLLNIHRDCAGVSAVEFALVAPLLLGMLVGTAQFGLTLNNYVMLTEGSIDGARQLALSRGSASPYTNTISAVQNAASNLTAANITITMTVNSTACNSDATCQTALNSASGTAGAVTASYACNLVVMGVDYAPGCTLTSTTTEMIE